MYPPVIDKLFDVVASGEPGTYNMGTAEEWSVLFGCVVLLGDLHTNAHGYPTGRAVFFLAPTPTGSLIAYVDFYAPNPHITYVALNA